MGQTGCADVWRVWELPFVREQDGFGKEKIRPGR